MVRDVNNDVLLDDGRIRIAEEILLLRQICNRRSCVGLLITGGLCLRELS